VQESESKTLKSVGVYSAEAGAVSGVKNFRLRTPLLYTRGGSSQKLYAVWRREETSGGRRAGEPGPSPGFSSRGGQKPRGGTFLKYCIGCMEQPGAKRAMGGTDFNWGAGHHWPPAGDDPVENVSEKRCGPCGDTENRRKMCRKRRKS